MVKIVIGNFSFLNGCIKKRNPLFYKGLRFKIAVRTRLELATSGVTGRHSNQTELPDRTFLERGQPVGVDQKCDCKYILFFYLNKKTGQKIVRIFAIFILLAENPCISLYSCNLSGKQFFSRSELCSFAL